MTEKIEWYKEVLALEPNSKIFFPLARMLEREGDLSQACEVLKEGVRRHGEFFEARLLLVELLERQGRTAECAAEIEVLAGMLARYEGFWSAWSASAGGRGADPALFVRMLGLSLRSPGVTVAELLRRGLDSFAMANAPQAALQPEAAASSVSGAEAPEAEAAQTEPAPSMEPQAEPAAHAKEAVALQPEAAAPAARPDAGQKEGQAPARAGGTSLRTRSMAEVLAEQGDIASAAEIYGELASAAPEGEREALLRRRDELQSLQASQPQAPERAEGGARPASKLVSLLENLAARVEARANS